MFYLNPANLNRFWQFCFVLKQQTFKPGSNSLSELNRSRKLCVKYENHSKGESECCGNSCVVSNTKLEIYYISRILSINCKVGNSIVQCPIAWSQCRHIWNMITHTQSCLVIGEEPCVFRLGKRLDAKRINGIRTESSCCSGRSHGDSKRQVRTSCIGKYDLCVSGKHSILLI